MEKYLTLIQAVIPKTFKALILYALTIFVTAGGLVSYVLLQSDQFQEILLKRLDRNDLKARFCEEAFEQESRELMQNTGAQAVVVWVTDLSGYTASKTVLYAIDKEHRAKIIDGWINKSSPIYATDQSRIDITHLLEGAVVCGKFEVFSEVGRRIASTVDGKYFCSSPVPPTAGHMIGVITAYFDHPVEATKAMQLEMRRAAKNITY